MGRKNKKIDHYAEREAKKYAHPIPSREYIMEVLADHGGPLRWQQLAHILGLSDPRDQEALIRRLRAMERDGQLMQNRKNSYGLVNKMDLICGHVIAHPDGYGFLVPDDKSDDLFLSAKQMRAIIHGDRIMARLVGVDRRGRREGGLVEVLERNTHQVVGRFFNDRGVGVVVPDNKRITHDIIVPPEDQRGARDSQIVVVELMEQPSKRHRALGRVVEVLGEHMAPWMEMDVAIRAHELPYEWNDAVLTESGRFPAQVSEQEAQGREDIRGLPLVTIDGADARDFDDAVYCERDGDGFRLVVAIADVSTYVKPGSALDEEAIERGNSVYFPNRVIPMLPETLSNGLCSLNPEVNRLCMVCDMRIDARGRISDYRFYDAIMYSHARLIYDDVAALLDGDETQRQRYAQLELHLRNLHELYQVLDEARRRRGTIEFETTETLIEFGENLKIEKIVPRERNVAHKMIEECMISANICAANYLESNEMPALYRIHDLPKFDKLNDLRAFLSGFGLQLEGGDDPEAADYARVLEQVQGRADAHLIQTVMLRSLNQAVYSPENIGHFGLALEEYAHFTSPIRRYPDLLVHRGIRHLINGGTRASFRYGEEDMLRLGDHCSMTERRADDATRDVVAWLKCEYMMDKVGECFDGLVTGVTSFGLFVELDEVYVEGLVHVTALDNDYYHFDPVKHQLVGERTRKTYRLADRVNVKVVRVDLDEKRIDFELEFSYDVKAHKQNKATGRQESAALADPAPGERTQIKVKSKASKTRGDKAVNAKSKKSKSKKATAGKSKTKKVTAGKKKAQSVSRKKQAVKKKTAKKAAVKKKVAKTSLKKKAANKNKAAKKLVSRKKTTKKKAVKKKPTGKQKVSARKVKQAGVNKVAKKKKNANKRRA